jgi:IS30 family transposase
LLRQYLPKGKDLAPLSQAQLNRIARELNERPRKTLDFETCQSAWESDPASAFKIDPLSFAS